MKFRCLLQTRLPIVAIGIVLLGNLLWLPLPLLNGDELASPEKPSAANSTIQITPPDPPNAGLLFVDHSPKARSGHLGHALVEYEDGKILAFYPNCSGDNNGHSAVGWMEFKRSEDGGKTWGEPEVLSYSKNLFEKQQGRTAMAERRS